MYTEYYSRPQCYMQRFVEISPPGPEKILEVFFFFIVYGHVGRLLYAVGLPVPPFIQMCHVKVGLYRPSSFREEDLNIMLINTYNVPG